MKLTQEVVIEVTVKAVLREGQAPKVAVYGTTGYGSKNTPVTTSIDQISDKVTAGIGKAMQAAIDEVQDSLVEAVDLAKSQAVIAAARAGG